MIVKSLYPSMLEMLVLLVMLDIHRQMVHDKFRPQNETFSPP